MTTLTETTFNSDTAYNTLVNLLSEVGITEDDFTWVDKYETELRVDIRVGYFSFISLKQDLDEFVLYMRDLLHGKEQTYAFSGGYEDLESAFAKALEQLA